MENDKPELHFTKVKNIGKKNCLNCGKELNKDEWVLQRKINNVSQQSIAFCMNCKVCPKLHKMNYAYNVTPLLN